MRALIRTKLAKAMAKTGREITVGETNPALKEVVEAAQQPAKIPFDWDTPKPTRRVVREVLHNWNASRLTPAQLLRRKARSLDEFVAQSLLRNIAKSKPGSTACIAAVR